jgi:carbonic anhydrase
MSGAETLPKHLQQRYEQMFEHNQAWAAAQNERDPEFYKKLTQGQTPDYLWIGCSDARVPAELVTGLLPGEAFVHRNVANVASNIDLSMMSAIDYRIN